MHLVVDGYGADPARLEDEALIYELLESYPRRLGMTAIAPPAVFRYIGTKPQDWGLSGFVIIAESHIAIHTFVERGLVNIDIFSCKPFNPGGLIADLKEKLALSQVKAFVLKRGLEYEPDDDTAIPVFEPALPGEGAGSG